MKKIHNYYSNTSIFDEAIRTLRTNVQFSEVDKKLKLLLLTSPNPSDGKSTISVNLARSFAQNNDRTLLIDCDLRNPSVGKVSGNSYNIGLTNVLTKNSTIDDVIIADNTNPNLHLMLSGPIPPNPSELLGSDSMKILLQNLYNLYDYIILDAPPIGIFTDAAILSTITDGTILVTSQDSTKIDDIQNSIKKIEHVGGNLLGTVLNKVKINSKKDYNHYYNNYY